MKNIYLVTTENCGHLLLQNKLANINKEKRIQALHCRFKATNGHIYIFIIQNFAERLFVCVFKSKKKIENENLIFLLNEFF